MENYTNEEITFKLNVMILIDNVDKFGKLGRIADQPLLDTVKY